MTDAELAIYIGEKIREYRTLKGLTQKELAQKIGMGDTTVANYEKGFRTPKKNTLFKLASAFDISIDDLFPPIQSAHAPDTLIQAINDTVIQLEEPRQEKVLTFADNQLKEQETEPSDKIIELNDELEEYHAFEKLSAGNGYDYLEDRNYDIVYYDKYIPHDLASWVYGDSMEPNYPNGSVALIKDTGWDYDGAVYAVDWDGQSYIKKVYKEKDGLRLVSLNDKYADKFAPFSEEPRIIGKVVGNFMPMDI